MRALLPHPADEVDLVAAYALPEGAGTDRPFVRGNMISSLDGAIAVGGRSGQLGGPADRRVFGTLRSLADVILVGAGTVRAEGYGPARPDAGVRAARRARGQAEVPPIAVVTGAADLDWSSPFFTEAEARPLVITSESGAVAAEDLGRARADIVVAGASRVDPARALDELHRAGLRSVLLEGGPGLNAEVVAAGRLDELCLTLSPHLVGGTGPRVLAGPELSPILDLGLVHLLEEDGLLFARLDLVRAGPG
jgi:riboflavin biosynthesis pyrimidine reductase